VTATASRNPSRQQARAALRTLQRDYARWARTCYRIRDKHGVVRPLVLNRVQLEMGRIEAALLAQHDEAKILNLKARQGGVTTDQQARSLHQIWSQPGFDALTLAHTKEDTDRIFEITRRAVEHFPPALLPTRGGKETSEISFPGLDTHFFTGTQGSKRTGRGLTIKRFHGSEWAFWDDLLGTLGGVTPALVPRGSVQVLETTASGYGSPAHAFWQEAEARGWVRVFFPWWDCDPVNYRLPLLADDELGTLEPDEQDLVARFGLDREQVKWRRRKMAALGKTLFLQEYAEDEESCWAAAGGMFYDAEVLKALQARAPQPIRSERGGTLQVYAEIPQGERRGVGPNPERVILGADTAEGGGGDRSTWVARSFPSWRTLSTFADNRCTPKEFAGLLNTWGRAYGMALLVVEKNAHGITVLRHLRDDHGYPLDRLYHRRPLDQQQESESDRIGWATTKESKPLLLDAGRELLHAARDGHAGVPVTGVLRDAWAVRRDEKGEVALNGRDLLVADMLAWIGRAAPIYKPFVG
jgi:hypothetical protein